ncbi:hypothetical protein Q5752_001263 [Cryptotrichosporon argae]
MPEAYRVEVSPSNRASCNGAKPCKGNKIMKGELRFGTWVEIAGNGSFKWRHWGCVTPRQLENIQQNFPEAEELDGYEDLPEDYQQKIRTALQEGHVDDADIPETAREPIQYDEEGNEIPRSQPSPKKSPARKKARKDAEEDGAEADVKPKKRAPRKKKVEDGEEEDEKPKREKAKSKGRKKRTPTRAEADISDESEALSSESEDVKPKQSKDSKKSKPKSSSKRGRGDASDGSEVEDMKSKKAKAAKSKITLVESDGSDDEVKPKKKAPKAKAEPASDDWSDSA